MRANDEWASRHNLELTGKLKRVCPETEKLWFNASGVSPHERHFAEHSDSYQPSAIVALG
jgi:hypothetical protein